MKRFLWGVAVALAACLLLNAKTAAARDLISHGKFQNVKIYQPKGQADGVVLLLSDGQGWNKHAAQMAQALSDQGALVAGIDTRQLIAKLDADKGRCDFPDGDLENLSRFVQAYEKLPGYMPPILAGEGAGAALAYVVAAGTSADIFSGLLTVDTAPGLALRKPLCKGAGVNFTPRRNHRGIDLLPPRKLRLAWVALPQHGDLDLAQWQIGYRQLNTRRAPAPPPVPAAVHDLPIVELPATGRNAGVGDQTMAVFLSGDGGWAGIDREIADTFAKNGVPVIGLDSLRYFWDARTPASAAADIARLMRFYMAHWHKSRVILVGYSQGADVLPFIVNRLPPDARAPIALTAMLALGRKADFQFRLSNWIKNSNDGLAIQPEVNRLDAGKFLCVYGSEETDSGCPPGDVRTIKALKLKGGHHFDGDNAGLAWRILEAAR